MLRLPVPSGTIAPMRTLLHRFRPALCVLPLLLAACGEDDVAPNPTIPERIRTAPSTESWKMPALTAAAHVIRTESNVPHIYATNRKDAAFLSGFVIARDRFFMIDLARRAGLGTLSEILGEYALPSDLQARHSGTPFVADQILASVTPEIAEHLDAFAAGINEYIARVKSGELDRPSELTIAGGFLNASDPNDLMKPFDRRAVAGVVALILYQTSYETGDVGRSASVKAMDTLFAGAKDEKLRKAGAVQDIYHGIRPMFPVSSAAGWGLESGSSAPTTKNNTHDTGYARPAFAPTSLTTRLADAMGRLQVRLRRNKKAGFGSNSWAVAGTASTDGAGLLAGDGHLDLSVPSVLYQIGVDTSVLGNGNLHQLGLVIPGLPLMPIGTNGEVAWSQTQLMEDVTDWYSEQLQLDANGAPQATMFKGEWKPVVRVEESYVIADIPAFTSKGRTETWARYTTFDGRFLADFEGRDVSATDPVNAGETKLSTSSGYLIPGDTDKDGKVFAISFDYGGFDAGSILQAQDGLGHAGDVVEFREASRGLVAYSQNFAVADKNGDIFYTGYQAIPCRGYLSRNADKTWADGSDPNLLLDGTRYGAFRIPIKDSVVDPSQGAEDPYACVVPFERIPQSMSPEKGYVFTANNDPGNLSMDDSLTNDEWYLGGPWDEGTRADTINRELKKAVEDKTADVAKMAQIQGNTDSRLGEVYAPFLVQAIQKAKAAAKDGKTPTEQRLGALYTADSTAYDEVGQRLTAWGEAGYQARSGVKTFYADPSAQDLKDSVATMLFNAWVGPCMSMVFDDEGIPGIWSPGGSAKMFKWMLESRGADNKLGLASWNPATQESVYFDDLATPEVESSDEIQLKALAKALAFLRSAPKPASEGGFGVTDMNQWIWGLRHQVRFESLLAGFLGDDPQFAFLTSKLAINTAQIPLAEDLDPSDPRSRLKWFPRNGDEWSVDAANPGFSGERFTYGSGPVMRLVVSLKNGAVTGRNIIPGGQSGLIDSPYFSDQAELWLGNKTWPLRFHPEDVLAGQIGHETYSP